MNGRIVRSSVWASELQIINNTIVIEVTGGTPAATCAGVYLRPRASQGTARGSFRSGAPHTHAYSRSSP
jgi:hypothetical protein